MWPSASAGCVDRSGTCGRCRWRSPRPSPRSWSPISPARRTRRCSSAAWLYGRHAVRLSRACRSLVDLDADGFSPVAWGTDCDDFDGAKNPLAKDPPGGGDSNCNGVDPPAEPTDAETGLAPPYGEPDA